jgi:hypothetical protein
MGSVPLAPRAGRYAAAAPAKSLRRNGPRGFHLAHVFRPTIGRSPWCAAWSPLHPVVHPTSCSAIPPDASLLSRFRGRRGISLCGIHTHNAGVAGRVPPLLLTAQRLSAPRVARLSLPAPQRALTRRVIGIIAPRAGRFRSRWSPVPAGSRSWPDGRNWPYVLSPKSQVFDRPSRKRLNICPRRRTPLAGRVRRSYRAHVGRNGQSPQNTSATNRTRTLRQASEARMPCTVGAPGSA